MWNRLDSVPFLVALSLLIPSTDVELPIIVPEDVGVQMAEMHAILKLLDVDGFGPVGLDVEDHQHLLGQG